MPKKTVLSILFLLSLSVSYGQSKNDKQLERILDGLLSDRFKPNDPGCAVLVAKKGRIVYEKAFGNADLELKVAARPDMIFRLGSISKQFTAIAILQLIEQGKLGLHDSIQKFIKDFPPKNHAITIEHLLTHTSGIKEYTQLDIPDPFIRRKDLSPKEVIDLFKNEPLEFQPGSTFKYSNSGYFLLGYILEGVAGIKYKDYMESTIFKPLGLANTYYDDPAKIIPNRAKGYKREGDMYENADYLSMTIPFAAGALISNVADLYKWHQALHQYTLIKKETLENAFMPYRLSDGAYSNYGYGWFVLDMNGSPSLQHGGNINGFKSNEIYFPKEDVFVATLFNCECAPMEELSQQIAYLSIGRILAEPGVDVPDVILTSYVGNYVMPESPQRPILISKENNRLYAAVPGEWKAELVAVSETKFNIKDIRPAGTIEFFKNENGKVMKVVTTQSGKRYEAIRTE
jgi:CubicO group peptidase (beta-lactamase class C family)